MLPLRPDPMLLDRELTAPTDDVAAVRHSFKRTGGYQLVLAFAPALALGLIYLWLKPVYPGSAGVLLSFLCASILLVAVAALALPSFFVVTLAVFLSLGFVAKLVAHLVFHVALIEPIGQFDGSSAAWDTALSFATAGLAGACAAIVVAAFIPVVVKSAPMRADRRNEARLLSILLVVQLALAVAVYALNYRWNIIRIGYPLGVDLPTAAYGVLAFVIAWGALLGSLFLTQRKVELGGLSHAALIYVAAILGMLASITMGSRVQLILFVGAASMTIAVQWRAVKSWWPVAAALSFAVVAFVLSVGLVSIERNFAFHTGPDNAQPIAKSRPHQERVLTDGRINGLKYELGNLFIMRWVGLEGAMTTAAESDALGIPLLAKALREDPAPSVEAIYQRMSGDKYRDVKEFVFLTLPGPIGVASFSGSLWVIAGSMFLLVLAGHLFERLAGSLTRSVAACSVVGVSLAYLSAQLNVPWTFMVYALELLAALCGLAILRLLIDRAHSSGST